MPHGSTADFSISFPAPPVFFTHFPSLLPPLFLLLPSNRLLQVLRKSDSDKVTVVGAGVTLHEALAAHKTLEAEGIKIRVVDAFCLKVGGEAGLTMTHIAILIHCFCDVTKPFPVWVRAPGCVILLGTGSWMRNTVGYGLLDAYYCWVWAPGCVVLLGTGSWVRNTVGYGLLDAYYCWVWAPGCVVLLGTGSWMRNTVGYGLLDA